jgi:hypothetical protein
MIAIERNAIEAATAVAAIIASQHLSKSSTTYGLSVRRVRHGTMIQQMCTHAMHLPIVETSYLLLK